jgi:hypothetical protein
VGRLVSHPAGAVVHVRSYRFGMLRGPPFPPRARLLRRLLPLRLRLLLLLRARLPPDRGGLAHGSWPARWSSRELSPSGTSDLVVLGVGSTCAEGHDQTQHLQNSSRHHGQQDKAPRTVFKGESG